LHVLYQVKMFFCYFSLRLKPLPAQVTLFRSHFRSVPQEALFLLDNGLLELGGRGSYFLQVRD
jgi:hypothetical protein